MSSIEFNEDLFSVILQYGIFNQDYPAAIKRWDFTIAIEANTAGMFYYEELSQLLEKMHESIKKTYEFTSGGK